MSRKPTVRASKRVSSPDTRESAPRAQLRRVSRVDLSNDALSLDFVADQIKDHATRPNGKPPIPRFATSFSLAEIQVLENQNRVLGSPFNKLLGCTMTEIFSSPRSLKLQPFEGSDDAPSIFTLCLSLPKLSLKSLDSFHCAFVLDFPIKTGHKQLVSICINRDDCVSLVEINSDRIDSADIRKFDGIRDVSDKLVADVLDHNAIDLNSVVKHASKSRGNGIPEMFSTTNCGNAQETVFPETGISTPLSHEEKCKGLSPTERTINTMSIRLGSRISSCCEPDTCTGELRRYSSFDIVVNATMQIKGFKRYARVPSSLGYAIAYLDKAIESLDKRFIAFDNYLQGSLSNHHAGDATMSINNYWLSGGEGSNSSSA